MTTWSQLFQGNFLEAADLGGKTVELEIESIEPPNTVKSEDGRLIDKPIIRFRGAKKALICNKTNGRRIALWYFPKAASIEDWLAGKIRLHTEDDRRPDLGGKKGPCVRVAPKTN